MAAELDSYWAGVEIHFYLHEHPTRGLLFLPEDMALAFGEQVWPELAAGDPLTYEHLEWGRELAGELVLSEPYRSAAFEAALRRARGGAPGGPTGAAAPRRPGARCAAAPGVRMRPAEVGRTPRARGAAPCLAPAERRLRRPPTARRA
jgi:hypothetical protein